MKSAGPPTCLKSKGMAKFKQEIQSDYYNEKIKHNLPRVNFDPLWTLKRVFDRWQPLEGKPGFSLKSVTVSEVFKIISKIKNSHTFGNDNLDATFIKLVAPTLSPVIAHIVNLSLGTVTFPARLKISHLIPLLKSKDCEATNTS